MLPWLQMDKTINTRGMQLADNELALKVGGEFLDASFQSALGGATSEYRVNFERDLKCLVLKPYRVILLVTVVYLTNLLL